MRPEIVRLNMALRNHDAEVRSLSERILAQAFRNTALAAAEKLAKHIAPETPRECGTGIRRSAVAAQGRVAYRRSARMFARAWRAQSQVYSASQADTMRQ